MCCLTARHVRYFKCHIKGSESVSVSQKVNVKVKVNMRQHNKTDRLNAYISVKGLYFYQT